MIDIFNEGTSVTLVDVLNNKEWRADQQIKLMTKYTNKVIMSVKLNIPGEVKNNQAIFRLFKAGWQKLITDYISEKGIIDMLYVDRITGPEGFIIVDNDINTIKRQAIQFELDFVVGRLFDVDVMSGNNKHKQLSRTALGFKSRQCFICHQPAKVCARSQKHDIGAMKAAINSLANQYFEVYEYV